MYITATTKNMAAMRYVRFALESTTLNFEPLYFRNTRYWLKTIKIIDKKELMIALSNV
jgi:hypothetical protein